MKPQPKVGIIIVGYNSKQYLPECFDSIYASTFPHFTLFFVDNHSSDQSVEFVQNHYPKAMVIRNIANLGFAEANNRGIKQALSQGADYVFLLNPDTVLDKKCLELLIDQANPKTILQPLVLLHDGAKTDLVNTTGNHLNFLGISYVGDYRKNRSSITKTDIVSASGAAMLVPKEICQKIGLLEESFFMYVEDMDWCWRARIAGFQIVLAPHAYVWHKYRFLVNPKKFQWVERNRLLFLLRNFQGRTLLLITPAVLLNELLTILYAAKNGWLVSKLNSYRLVIGQLPQVMKARGRLRRVKTDRDLKYLISSDLGFEEIKIPLLGPYNHFLRFYWALIYPLI